MEISTQILYLFVLALPVACISWTVTHEEVFREPREYCEKKATTCTNIFQRKFFYVFTCEYCFSHYISLIFISLTGYTLIYSDWRGFVISFFALVWIANFYMSIFGLVRVGLKKEKAEANLQEEALKEVQEEKKI